MQARYKRATAQDPHAFFTTLPEGSPDDGSLDIMLERGWCFVCDRPAPKGSKEWHHIESIRNRSKKTSDENVADLHVFFDGIQRNVTAFSIVDRIKGDVARVRKQIKDFDRIKSTDELIYNLLNDYKQSREQITKEILRAVFLLEDIKQQRVLYIHFIEGKTWEKVAEIMQYEYRHLIRIAKQAIENLPDMEVVDLWQ